MEEDLPRIGPAAARRVLRAIEAKLSRAPEAFGKALAGPLRGYRRLAVGPYRVIYVVRRTTVTVLVAKVGARRDDEVYREALRRLGLAHK